MREHLLRNKFRYPISAAAVLLLILFDQLTKDAAKQYLKIQGPLVLWEGVFELRYLENRGAAFGILQNQRFLFLILTVFLLFGILYVYCCRIPSEKRYRALDVIAVLFFAGAVGNFIDRLVQNYVIDFFYFSLIDFPIFNMADIYVVAASSLLIVLGLFYYKDKDFERILGKR